MKLTKAQAEFLKQLREQPNARGPRAAFLLRHGRFYQPQPRPTRYRRGSPRACFNNALLLAMRRQELQYVEGIALSAHVPAQIHHCWCIDTAERVVDTTWEKPGVIYFGVPFSLQRVAAALLAGRDADDEALLHEPYEPPTEISSR